MGKNITHEGVVVAVDGQWVTVHFVQHSACSECHAKTLCSGGTSESADRKVVANSYGQPYQVGEHVRVVVADGLAWSAVVVAFLVPLVLALACLFVTVNLTGSQLTGCLSTMALLGVYYLLVWTQRKRLERRVEFTIERSLSNP